MPSDIQSPASKLSNLRLITSKRTVFIFIVNPTLSFAWLFFNLTYLLGWFPDMPLWNKACLAMLYPFLALILQIQEATLLSARLREAGYCQKWTRAGMFDLALNGGVIVACYYWLDTLEDSSSDPHMTYLALFLGWVIWVGGSFLAILGPIVWFTTKSRR